MKIIKFGDGTFAVRRGRFFYLYAARNGRPWGWWCRDVDEAKLESREEAEKLMKEIKKDRKDKRKAALSAAKAGESE